MATSSDEILVAEHDPAVAELIRRYLAKDGLTVRAARTAAEAAAGLAGCRAAVVVLDLTMPGLDAREIRRIIRPRPGPRRAGRPQAARRARAQPTVRGAAADIPVVCLAAGDGAHPAQGLRPQDVGVDPAVCLARPFGPRTLVARVRAAARAAQPGPAGPSHTAGRLTVDPARRRATADGADLALTGTEFDVLDCLVRSAGRALSRATLRAVVWGPDGAGGRDGGGDRIVDVYIAQLRTKIGPAHGIRTVRGIGYVVDATAHDGTQNPGGRSGGQKPPATIGDAGHPTRGDSGTA